jgi:spore germination protein KC
MNRLLLVLFILVNVALLSGCWDRKELNDLAIVTGVGIDEINERKIELTVQMLIPKASGGAQMMGSVSSGGEGGGTLIRTGTGATAADAISNLQEKTPRQLFWGHTEVIIFGEKVAKKGIIKYLDFLSRHRLSRLRAHVFVCKGKAMDVLKLIPPLERSSSEVLRELSNSELLMNVTLRDTLQMLTGDTGNAGLPLIEILPPMEGKDQLQTIGYINRTAVLKKDKMIGDINDRLTRGLLWLRGEVENAIVTVTPDQTKKKGSISTKLLRANTELIPEIKNGKWKITVRIITEDEVLLNETHIDLMNPNNIRMLERELESDLKGRIKLTLKKVQKEMKVDIIGFGEAFHRKYPKEWLDVKERWDEVFPTVEVTLNIKSNVRRPGMSTNLKAG